MFLCNFEHFEQWGSMLFGKTSSGGCGHSRLGHFLNHARQDRGDSPFRVLFASRGMTVALSFN
jgi:hypothetical protein